MEILLPYDELEMLAQPYVSYMTLNYVNINTIHVKLEVKKFLLTHSCNINVIVDKLDDKELVLSYMGKVSFWARKAIEHGLIDKKLPIYIKRKGHTFIIKWVSIPQIPRSLILHNIAFLTDNICIKLIFK